MGLCEQAESTREICSRDLALYIQDLRTMDKLRFLFTKMKSTMALNDSRRGFLSFDTYLHSGFTVFMDAH